MQQPDADSNVIKDIDFRYDETKILLTFAEMAIGLLNLQTGNFKYVPLAGLQNTIVGYLLQGTWLDHRDDYFMLASLEGYLRVFNQDCAYVDL